MPKIAKVLLISVIVLVVAVAGGTYGYTNFINDETPERLTFSTSTTVGSAPGSAAPITPLTTLTHLDGAWVPTEASQVGYRVKEILFGQDTEGVGRTNAISGTLVVAGTTVSKTDLSVDMASVRSDQSNRDNQFRTRIMSTDEFPAATFVLTQPIQMPRSPDATPFTVRATGDLTLRGVTRSVTTDLQVRRSGDNVEINGSIPITFSEWDIPNPSFGPAQTEDEGELELLVVFAKQG